MDTRMQIVTEWFAAMNDRDAEGIASVASEATIDCPFARSVGPAQIRERYALAFDYMPGLAASMEIVGENDHSIACRAIYTFTDKGTGERRVLSGHVVFLFDDDHKLRHVMSLANKEAFGPTVFRALTGGQDQPARSTSPSLAAPSFTA